jgi:hypothetical protein
MESPMSEKPRNLKAAILIIALAVTRDGMPVRSWLSN